MDKSRLNKADELKDRLAGLRPLNAGEVKRLREEFVIENTYNANAIEGGEQTSVLYPRTK